jgi:methionine-rich copper-binding protein CopC
VTGAHVGRRRQVRGGRVLLVLVGAVLTLVVGAGPAAAHNVLRGTSPGPGAQVGPTPAQVVLTFDQPAVAMGTQILVTGPTGQVQSGAARLVDDTVTQDVAGGAPAGTYTVAWRVTSADGHPVSGTFTFTSTSAGTGPAVAASAPADRAEGAEGSPARTGVPRAAVVTLAALALVAVVVVVVLARRRRSAGSERG